jgi:hypothetical protein
VQWENAIGCNNGLQYSRPKACAGRIRLFEWPDGAYVSTGDLRYAFPAGMPRMQRPSENSRAFADCGGCLAAKR